MKKKIITAVIAALVLALVLTAVSADAPVVKEIIVFGNRVEIEFRGHVQYKDTTVTVTDETGKSYDTQILERDDDDISFAVSGMPAEQTLNYVIRGVREGRSESYTELTGTFRTASGMPGSEQDLQSGKMRPSSDQKDHQSPQRELLSIKKLEYDREDGELEIEFNGKISAQSAKIVLTDAAGCETIAEVREWESDEIEASVSGLKSGISYTVTVSGIAPRDGGETVTFTGTLMLK